MPVIEQGNDEPSKVEVSVEASVVFEFLISLAAFGNPEQADVLEAGRSWFTDTRAHLSPDFASAWSRAGPDAGRVWLNLLDVVKRRPPARTISGFLQRVGRMPPAELRAILLGSRLPGHERGTVDRRTVLEAAQGDRAAKARLVADTTFMQGAGKRLEPLLSLDSRGTRAVALRILQGWYRDYFQAREASLREMLSRDADQKAALLTRTSPERVIELASGFAYRPGLGRERVVLSPQLSARPWVLSHHQAGGMQLFYPIADEFAAGDPGAPPARLVRLMKALGDSRRLKLLKYLESGNASLQDLADRLGMPKTTVHHHLVVLRMAGLVQSPWKPDQGYAFRREALPEASALLDAFLEEGRHERGT